MIQRIPLAWTTAFCNSTTEKLIPSTMWLPAGQIVGVRATFEIASRTGDNECGVGVDFADVEDSPDLNPITLFARQTSVDMFFGTSFVSLSTQGDSKRLLRFGWLVANTATSNLSCVRAGGYLDIQYRN